MVSYLLIGERCLLATVFGIAFFSKVRDISKFQQVRTSIQKLTMLSTPTAMLVTLLLVICEGTTATLLALPLAPRVGFALATGLLVLLTAVVIRAVRGGVLVECRCFGRSGSLMGNAMIVRNLLLMAFAVPGIILSPTTPTTDLVYLALALIVGCILAVFFTRYYDRLIRVIVKRRVYANAHGRVWDMNFEAAP
jgi:hypothetical protein